MPRTIRNTLAGAISVAALLAAYPVSADTTADLKREIEALKKGMKEMKTHYEGRIEELESRLDAVEQENTGDGQAGNRTAARTTKPILIPPETRTPAPQNTQSAPASVTPPPVVNAPAQSNDAPRQAASDRAVSPPARGNILGASTSLPLNISANVTASAGFSDVDNETLEGLQIGDHDPRRNGFNLQTTELTFSGTVDPYFDAQATVAMFLDENAETIVELEEAFFTTRKLPHGLQVKGGHYHTEFGRHNTEHVHQWAFADQPVIIGRFFGPDGLRAPGARVSWLSPLPWFSEFYVGAQNSRGEAVHSFLRTDEAGEAVAAHPFMDVKIRSPKDLLYSARWLNGFDVSDNTSVNLGTSFLYGPNATGSDNHTYILGTDLYAKWQPERTQRGFPFVAFQAEGLYRKFEAGEQGAANRETLHDWGAYAQALWGFDTGWVLGLRGELAGGHGSVNVFDAGDPERDTRVRFSPNLTWYPSEFSKLRLQWNADRADHLNDNWKHTFWFQVDFSLGSHAAHKF